MHTHTAHVPVRSRRSILEYALLPHGSSFCGALIPAAYIVICPIAQSFWISMDSVLSGSRQEEFKIEFLNHLHTNKIEHI